MPIKQAFADELCSLWHPASMNPVHPGWYECRGPRIDGFLHLLWTGEKWLYFGPRHSDPRYPSFGKFKRDQWRGITADEHERRNRSSRQGPGVIDITGRRFGLVVALQREYTLTQGGARWRFRCDCGREFVSNAKWFRAGNSATCGCGQFKKRMVDVKRPWPVKGIENLNFIAQ